MSAGRCQLVGDSIEQWSVENGTALNLQRRAVVLPCAGRRDDVPVAGTACRHGVARRIRPSRAERPSTRSRRTSRRSKLRRCARRGHQSARDDGLGGLGHGSCARATCGWWPGPTDMLPGLTIQPSASQSRIRTVVLVHLRYGPLPPPVPDANLRVDVQETREDPTTTGRRAGVPIPRPRTTGNRHD